MMAAIFALSSMSRPPRPDGVSDTTGHVAGYAALGATIVRALAGGFGARVTPAAAAGAIVGSVLYGVTDEFHQSFVPGRTADIRDVYADAAGALLAVGACWAWGILAARRPAARRSP